MKRLKFVIAALALTVTVGAAIAAQSTQLPDCTDIADPCEATSNPQCCVRNESSGQVILPGTFNP